MPISDLSSDLVSSDLPAVAEHLAGRGRARPHPPGPAAAAGGAARGHWPLQRLLARPGRHRLPGNPFMNRITATLSRLDRLLPAPLASAPFSLRLEIARHFTWLQPPAQNAGKRLAIMIEDSGLRSCFTC